MPIDLKELVTPGHSAVITCEMQRGIIGDLSGGAPLATECADQGITEAAAILVHAARTSRVPVVHTVTEQSFDFTSASFFRSATATFALALGRLGP